MRSFDRGIFIWKLSLSSNPLKDEDKALGRIIKRCDLRKILKKVASEAIIKEVVPN